MIEVDLVAKRGQMLIVVEVKYRQHLDDALAAIRPDAVRRLRRAAEQLAIRHAQRGGPPLSARVDLLALAPGHWPRHIQGLEERGTPWT